MNHKNLKFYSIDEGLKLFFDYKQTTFIKTINKFSYLFFPLVESFSHKNALILKNVFETTNSNIFFNYPDKEYLKTINKNFCLSLKNFIIKYGNDKILDFFVSYFLIFFILPLGKISDFQKYEQIICNLINEKRQHGTLEYASLNGKNILMKLDLDIDWVLGNKISLIIGLIYEIYILGQEKSYFDNDADQKFFALCSLINHKEILVCENYPYILYLLIDDKKQWFSKNMLDVLYKIDLFNIQCFNLRLIKKYITDKDTLIKLSDYYHKT